MPRCDCCKYIYYPEYESSYTECQIFGDEIPEKYERKDGEGCICNDRTLKKLIRQNEEALKKEAQAMYEYFCSEEATGEVKECDT